MSRKVHRLKDLRHAEFVETGPFNTTPKLKGKAKEGILYQALVREQAIELGGNHFSEQWIRFKDGRNIYHCRPDDIIEHWDRVIVIESKLSLRQLEKGIAQLRLYKPLLAAIYKKPIVSLLAFKHWTVGSKNKLPMIRDLTESLYTPPSQLNKIHGWNFHEVF